MTPSTARTRGAPGCAEARSADGRAARDARRVVAGIAPACSSRHHRRRGWWPIPSSSPSTHRPRPLQSSPRRCPRCDDSLARARRCMRSGELRAALALLEGEVDERHAPSVDELRRRSSGSCSTPAVSALASRKRRSRRWRGRSAGWPPGDEMVPEVPLHQLRERRPLPELRATSSRCRWTPTDRREDCPRRAGVQRGRDGASPDALDTPLNPPL